eukprot:gnl/TRDRNA2_/TRDRNA2_67092_c0_seq1.p1 gnl/TRDRNA2_/TRDRNA2_67092_c0~~gnl/TRDRNA2_/TRDRNA2_67092_c0_seq1.p1  ORF type:complete len:383 (-),score=101.92 gnl/TRDRNA2_/TRDRNA2_67092_c0_seq1:128-1276(-)
MDAPCCVGVVRDKEGLSGKELTIGKDDKALKAYFSSPKTKSGMRMGVVVIHDIFGFHLPNCKYIADHLAAKGFDAIMPDLYTGKKGVLEGSDPCAWPATETEITKELGTEEFQKFFGSITSEDYWEGFKADMDECIKFLERKGCKKYGIVGFCWGGIAAEKAGQGGKFSASVSCHGCMHDAESYKKVQCPISYLTVAGDAFFSKESQDSIKAAGGTVKVFEGMSHGFVVRGDFAGDAKVKAAADEAMADAVALFCKASLRKPKMIKIGALQPYSTGINFIAKVTGEVKEVSEARKDGSSTKFYEVTCGDETSQVILSLKEFQKDGLAKDKVLCIRNGSIRMVKGFMRVVVDKWGKLDLNAEGTVESVSDKNISLTEYELVNH